MRRNSDWDENNKANILNGMAKPILKQQEMRLLDRRADWQARRQQQAVLLLHALEFLPRTGGNDTFSFRFPTELERRGDFSQSLDNLGAPYPFIKDPNIAGVCSAADQTACFRDGGVLGRIPADRLYQPGLNILKMWPLPNGLGTTTGRNHELVRPAEESSGTSPPCAWTTSHFSL